MSNKTSALRNKKGDIVKIVPTEQKYFEEDLATAEYQLEKAKHAVRMNEEIIEVCKRRIQQLKDNSQSITNTTN